MCNGNVNVSLTERMRGVIVAQHCKSRRTQISPVYIASLTSHLILYTFIWVAFNRTADVRDERKRLADFNVGLENALVIAPLFHSNYPAFISTTCIYLWNHWNAFSLWQMKESFVLRIIIPTLLRIYMRKRRGETTRLFTRYNKTSSSSRNREFHVVVFYCFQSFHYARGFFRRFLKFY